MIEEAATFPNGKHDDQVDAFSQAINWAQTKTSTTPGGCWVPTGEIPIDPYSHGLTGPIGHTPIHPYEY